MARSEDRQKQITIMEQCWEDALKVGIGRSLDDRGIAEIASAFFQYRMSRQKLEEDNSEVCRNDMRIANGE